jgi:hypothetical protein
MFTTTENYTLQQVLDSLDYYINEYAEIHCVWFLKEGEDLAEKETAFVKNSMNSNLYRCVYELYDYVFHQKYNLSDTDSSIEYPYYPYISPPATLQHCATQLFRFWYQFVTSGALINPSFSDLEKPLATLAIEGYLRFRVDFASPGIFIKAKLTNESDREEIQFIHFMKNGAVPSLFTLSEMALISGDSLSRLRGKIKESGYLTPLFIEQGVTEHHGNKRSYSTGAKKIESTRNIPESWQSIFDGSVVRGVQKLISHQHLINYVSQSKQYVPTTFTGQINNKPLFDYSNSGHIYAALIHWADQNQLKSKVQQMLAAIFRDHDREINNNKNTQVTNSYLNKIEKGKFKFSICSITLLNNKLKILSNNKTDLFQMVKEYAIEKQKQMSKRSDS